MARLTQAFQTCRLVLHDPSYTLFSDHFCRERSKAGELESNAAYMVRQRTLVACGRRCYRLLKLDGCILEDRPGNLVAQTPGS
jgi:hypothetical protein